jgi:hypothetical protein
LHLPDSIWFTMDVLTPVSDASFLWVMPRRILACLMYSSRGSIF